MTRSRHSFPKDYILQDGVFVPSAADREAFGYSDGDDSESYLLDLIANSSDRSSFSQQLRAGIRDWPSLYHLSSKRPNLLRPFEHLLRGTVLEVGAGCGALTRFLGENGGKIVAIEGSSRRSYIAKQRVSDLPNVSVVCDHIEAFASTKAFDVVLAIGVLEYAAIYELDQEYAHLNFLKRLRQYLSREGVVILAIENKLGLKYFAGAPEDHVGAEFHGINNAYGPGTVATFGHEELATLLSEAGLPAQAFFFPCPDYKLPTTILSTPLIDRHPNLAATLISQSVLFDPQRPTDPTFSLEQGWANLGRNGLLKDLANSFLVVAGTSDDSIAPYTALKSLGWHYTVDRHPAFTKETRFEFAHGSFNIRRRALANIASPAVPLRRVLSDEPLQPGENWWVALSSIVNKPGWSLPQLAAWARIWIGALTRQCGVEAFDAQTLAAPVAGKHFDATPFNMTQEASGDVHFFDQEWHLTEALELGYLIYRGLRDSLARVSSYAQPAAGTPVKINDMVIGILAECGVPLTRPDIDRYALVEGQIQAWVQGRAVSTMTEADASNYWAIERRDRLPSQRKALVKEVKTARTEEERIRAALAASDQKRQELREELAQTHADHAGEIAALRNQLDQAHETHSRTRHALEQQLGAEREAHAREAQLAQSQTAQLSTILAAQARELDKLASNQRRALFAATRERLVRAFTPWKHTRFRQKSWEAGVIRASRLFRPLYYLERYPDVTASGIDPLLHYILHGAAEGRIPHPLFDPSFYAAQLAEGERAAMSPLAHYASAGVAQGLDPHPLFDTDFYLRENPDVAAAGVNPLAHYMEHGWREGRNPNPLFDTAFYRKNNPALAASGENPLLHYLEHGTPHALGAGRAIASWTDDERRSAPAIRQ